MIQFLALYYYYVNEIHKNVIVVIILFWIDLVSTHIHFVIQTQSYVSLHDIPKEKKITF